MTKQELSNKSHIGQLWAGEVVNNDIHDNQSHKAEVWQKEAGPQVGLLQQEVDRKADDVPGVAPEAGKKGAVHLPPQPLQPHKHKDIPVGMWAGPR